MHKAVLKFFSFLKSCTEFFKILIMFCIMLFILYWIQNLVGSSWGWLAFSESFFDFLVRIGQYINSGKTILLNATFEYKYLIALAIIITFYALAHFIYICLEKLQDLYERGRILIKKIEENNFNNSLEKQNTEEQQKLKRYQIYVKTQLKPKYAHREHNINMEEQNQIMLKFLIEKTGTYPQNYQNGFLFTFDRFGEIDRIIEIFSKLLQSTAPIDYFICVQVLGIGTKKEIEQINTLIELKILNKIVMMADTAYRYSFNDICKYQTSQVGLFQKNKNTFEVHEFIV